MAEETERNTCSQCHYWCRIKEAPVGACHVNPRVFTGENEAGFRWLYSLMPQDDWCELFEPRREQKDFCSTCTLWERLHHSLNGSCHRDPRSFGGVDKEGKFRWLRPIQGPDDWCCGWERKPNLLPI